MLDKIKDSVNFVAENAKHVQIDLENLKKFALSIENISDTSWLDILPLENLDIRLAVNFLLIFESICFSFWSDNDKKWHINTKQGKLDGSIGLFHALLNYVKVNKTWNFAKITRQEFADLIGDDIPLFLERYRIVKKVSQIVNSKMAGDFYEYIKDVNDDKILFAIIIKNFPNFKDERTYHGHKIYFYKLAQLLTSDILHLKTKKLNIVTSYHNLIGCADYKIPMILRGLGILKYDKKLANIIDNRKVLKLNSVYEVEIRAQMLKCILLINEYLNNKFSCIAINDFLYSLQKKKDISFKSYHLVRCVNY